MVQVLADPSVKERFAELGIEITPLAQQSPEALRAFQKAEMERWWSIIKAANIKTEKVELPAIPGGLLPPSVIASASEAIHQDKRGQSGLLRRFASRNKPKITGRN